MLCTAGDGFRKGIEKVSLDYQCRPIGEWPQRWTTDRRETVFKNKAGRPMPLSDTLGILERELPSLNARNVIVQVALSERDLRQDGMIRANARRPTHPGVILTFDSKYGPLSYPCDTFTDWESNLRAIAYHLENTRHAALYGVGKHGEGYRGFTALPPPSSNALGVPDDVHRAAVHILHVIGGAASKEDLWKMVTDAEVATRWARMATGKAHPDGGGSNERFEAARNAQAVIAKYHLEKAKV